MSAVRPLRPFESLAEPAANAPGAVSGSHLRALGEAPVVAGKYRLGRVLGAGGMGVVHAAEHLGLGEPVALKFLHEQYAGSEQIVERFMREARAQFRIKSDHVVRVLDVGTAESGAPYIAMELLDGASLGDVCEATPRMPYDVACEIVRQACDALESAHQLGIIHRDVKPGNLMVCPSAGGLARIKLLDFGIAQIARAEGVSRLTMTETVIGTPLYMAPEQMRSARATDPRSDLWSIGVVLYRLLTGSLPFVGESLADLVYLQHHAPPARVDTLAQVPVEVADAVARCLSVAPAERYASAADLAAALAPFARPVAVAELLAPVLAARHATAALAAPLAAPIAAPAHGTARLVTPVPISPAAGMASVSPTQADAAGLTFVRRKVQDTSGATAFAVHELAPRDERNLTTGPRYAPVLPAPPRAGVTPTVIAAGVATALLLLAVSAFGFAWGQRRPVSAGAGLQATTAATAMATIAATAATAATATGASPAAAPVNGPSTAISENEAASPSVVAPSNAAPVVLPATASATKRPSSGTTAVTTPSTATARPEPKPSAAASSSARPSIYTEKW